MMEEMKSREVKQYRGTELNTKGWIQEAALRIWKRYQRVYMAKKDISKLSIGVSTNQALKVLE
ncbi:hypothetical protein [Oceanobacillus sp. CFH 90083]|uniref:hypothetical protein n=1 Tax=Oceanobacillus sp. CFH 90083 TaxID=2592336 RepID=UPI00128CEB5F|nr:hypothetical protein [Oceanobacillus sp. CFH 90083]